MRFSRFKLFLLAALTVAMAGACSTKPRYYISIEVLGAETACQNMDIDFTSYDYNGILDSLTRANNPGPRPDSTELMALQTVYQNALSEKTLVADSVNTFRDALEKMKNTSIEYRKFYPMFQDLQKREEAMSDNLQKVHNEYLQLKNDYQQKMTAWKEKAYVGFSDFKSKISPDMETKTESTDQNCMIKKLDLPYGQWWLHTELRRPGTITETLVWNIKLPTAGGDSVAIVLDESNADVVQELF